LINNTVPGFESSCRQMLKTVTVKLQLAVFPPKSVTVQVTVLVPSGNEPPDGGLHTGAPTPQLPPTVGAGYVTTAPVPNGQLAGAVAVMFAGQVIDGGIRVNGVAVKARGVTISDQPLSVPVSTANWSDTSTVQIPFVLVPLKRLKLPTGS
jgi:hypothetical protein